MVNELNKHAHSKDAHFLIELVLNLTVVSLVPAGFLGASICVSKADFNVAINAKVTNWALQTAHLRHLRESR
jgi:hypothetical protein